MLNAFARPTMERRLDSLELDIEYRSGDDNLITDFYRPCLSMSVQYDRASGYFRSSVAQAIGESFLDFAQRGGKFRLICSPDLTEVELQDFRDGYRGRAEVLEAALTKEIEGLLAKPRYSLQASLFATMIASCQMEVRIAFRPDDAGIYHEKLGFFTDSANQHVSFKGSANETWNGWHSSGNHESFDVFRSWVSASERQRTSRHIAYFERLWRGEVPGLEIVPFPKVTLERLLTVAHSSYEGLTLKSPARTRSLFDHQRTGIEAWELNGQRGILEHATGSGKTFTALNIIARHVRRGEPCLVLVPSKLLFLQWIDEIQKEIPDAIILPCGSGKNNWRNSGRLESFFSPNPELGPRIVVAMMVTAASDDFMRRCKGSPALLIVADEVHRTGSQENRTLYTIDARSRLGLSATPERFGDPDGTAAMLDYFGKILSPPFTLQDAIKANRLVPYEYHAHRVSLDKDETEEWENISKTINREIAIGGGPNSSTRSGFSDALKMLLIRRARIAKNASGKVDIAVRVIRDHFVRGDFWLIYCDNQRQLDKIRKALADLSFPVNEYHSAMTGDPEQTLKWFSNFGGILISIRCLDEGVDIPQISHALILASSQNPREYIQRRGRVLRVPPDPLTKTMAVVHDALVLPHWLDDEPTQTSLVKSELSRAIQFAKCAMNRGAVTTLMQYAIEIGMDSDAILSVGIEEEDDAA